LKSAARQALKSTMRPVPGAAAEEGVGWRAGLTALLPVESLSWSVGCGGCCCGSGAA
jgi:hypothetical protein